MKRARLGGLVLLALVFCLLMSTEGFALDHPWDDNKFVDTSHQSLNGNSGTKNGSGDEDDVDDGGSFWDWFLRLFRDPVGDKPQERPESRTYEKAEKSTDAGKKSFGLYKQLNL
ncbi:MAG: hypothetical protein GF404_13875 [candidate division Zixibacteria bacterium]|mgnify:CR=1 FL=1|jgi:hypothetical protein|nr:hypothetical protein [candidate division Zixibacteria bacterium]